MQLFATVRSILSDLLSVERTDGKKFVSWFVFLTTLVVYC
jgi:hypothetical protein